VKVSGLSGVTAIAAGGNHSLALKDDGTVWAWGYNGQGQLGSGIGTGEMEYPNPMQVELSAGDPFGSVVDIAAGYNSSFALKNDGTLWAWGHNDDGQLGDGTDTNRRNPVQVMASEGVPFVGVVAVSSGPHHTLALKSDGTIWAWGSNNNGELGDGGNVQRSAYPVQVKASNGVPLSGVTAIAAGGSDGSASGFSLALKNDGTVWAWGQNGYGKLGNGDDANENQKNPVQVMASAGVPLSGVAAIAASKYHHTLALKDDGAVWAWGKNNDGQLGNGTETPSGIPVQVSGGLNLGATTRVTFTAAQVGGAVGTADSTEIQLAFNAPVSGLTADKITVFKGDGEVMKGAVTGSGTTWTLELKSVDTQGSVTVRIDSFDAYIVTTTAQIVAVYKYDSKTAAPQERGTTSGADTTITAGTNSETDLTNSNGFPWWILALVGALVLIGVVAIVIIVKKKKMHTNFIEK